MRAHFPSAAALVLVSLVAAPAATSRPSLFRPVIGLPLAAPTVPAAGEEFVVVFPVSRSDTGRPLARATMHLDPKIGTALVPHSELFHAGRARVALRVPDVAEGRTLNIDLRVTAGGATARRLASYRVPTVPLPTLTVADVRAEEGNAGTTPFAFRLQLSAATKRSVSVDYATADGTALAGSDYAAASGTVVFAPGETEKTVAVDVLGDLPQEPDETFQLRLTNALNATVGTAAATATIVDDELVLLTPTANAIIAQNAPDTGCSANPRYGTGFTIRFSWRTNGRTDIAAYGLLFMHQGAIYPLINAGLGNDTPSYVFRDCDGYVAGANLQGWFWRVTAVDARGNVLATATGNLGFAECRLQSGAPCG